MLQPQTAGPEAIPARPGGPTLGVVAPGQAGESGGGLEASLARWLGEAAREAGRRGEPVLASWVTPLEPQEPLALFRRARAVGTRLFWSERRPSGQASRLVLVGAGVAHQVRGEGEGRFRSGRAQWAEMMAQSWVQGAQVPATGPVLLGGFAFDPEGGRALPGGPAREGPPVWQGFPAGLLIVPQLLVTGWGRDFWLTVNAWVEPGAQALPQARRLAGQVDAFLKGEAAHGDRAAEPARQAPGALQVLERDPAPWMRAVAEATQAVRDGLVAKVVLARPQRVQIPEGVTPDRVLAALARQNPQATLFALDLGEGVFLGATPEHLAQVTDGWVESMALAGSAPRGAQAEEDGRLGRELLASAKNQEEHQVVVAAVREALQPLVPNLEVAAEPGLLKLPTIQHLFTPVRGRLASGATLLEVVERMHPTPAVGGAPKGAALALIRRLEGWDRGWYAAPVGWMDGAGNGAFAVALRSGLLRGTEAHLFAGCGIVGASQPEEEYREWQVKLRPMLAALEEAGR